MLEILPYVQYYQNLLSHRSTQFQLEIHVYFQSQWQTKLELHLISKETK